MGGKGKGQSAGGSKARTIADVMTSDPVSLRSTDVASAAAEVMRENDIGDVIVLDDESEKVCGIVTDRDIVVRVVAPGRDPSQTTLGTICSSELHSVTPDDSIKDGIKLMREHAVRRVPVLQDGKAVGVVSLGDLAVERDPESALADISGAPPNE